MNGDERPFRALQLGEQYHAGGERYSLGYRGRYLQRHASARATRRGHGSHDLRDHGSRSLLKIAKSVRRRLCYLTRGGCQENRGYGIQGG
jgi:hypothetical protein